MALLFCFNRNTLLAMLALLVSGVFADQLVDRGAKVNFFVGKVMVKRGGEKEWLEAKIGMKLKSADVVRTYVESKCDIETPEGTVINIQENTVFELSEIFENARTKSQDTKVNIKTGSVWANVKKLTNKRSSFVFETPTATAAIRGTELGVDVSEGRTRIHVKEGSVEVQGRSGGKPVYVFQNQQALVEKGKDGVNVSPAKGDSGKGGNGLNFEIISPKDGQELAGLTVPINGKTAPGATIKIIGGTDVIAGADGSFSGSLSLPEGTTGEFSIIMAAIFEGRTSTKTIKVLVKKADGGPVKVVTDANGCLAEIVTPANGSDVEPDFTVTGKLTSPDKNAQVFVNGVPASVSGNSFTAQVTSGFKKDEGGQLSLVVSEPKNGDKIVKLPVIIRGRVTPATAKVLIDGTKEARVSSDGAFEAEYPMSDETGNYDFEASAVLESGQEIKKKFDVNVQTGCNGVKSAPVKYTYNLDLGMGKTSGEKKQAVAFHYEKQRYDLVLVAGQAVCGSGRVSIDVKTNAAELRADNKVLPLTGAGGTLRSTRFDVDLTDRGCYPENEVTFAAADESANPPTKEQTVSWTCPLLNLEKPELAVTPMTNCLSIRVNDKSFLCDKADEDVLVTVEATGKGQIFDFEVTKNGESQCVPFEDGINLLYTVKAVDKGKNLVTQTYQKNGFMSRQATITLIEPRSFNYTIIKKMYPPLPPDMSSGEVEIPISFRIELQGDADNYKLIKRVEFRPSTGKVVIYEGASLPTDLVFDNGNVLVYNESEFGVGVKKGYTKTLPYQIKVIDVIDRVIQKMGTVTILYGN